MVFYLKTIVIGYINHHLMANIWEKTISILAENLNSGRSYFITAVPSPHSYNKYCTYSHHLHPLLNTRGRNFKDFTKKKCLPKSGLKKYKPCYSQVPNKKVGLFFWANYLALLVYLAPESIMARVRQSNTPTPWLTLLLVLGKSRAKQNSC